MKKLFLLFILLTTIAIQGQYTTIPDRNFEQALINLGIDNGTTDGIVLTSNVSGVTDLNVAAKNISDLTGIQDFTSLRFLECSFNKLTNLDLIKNIALEKLTCKENQLIRLDISKNTFLNYLNCNDNKLTDLNTTTNTSLTYLNCNRNKLTNIDLFNNTALSFLDCGINELINLEISKNNLLTNLNCSSNQLTSLNVTTNINLVNLSCWINQITKLDVSKNTKLTLLWCQNNPLTSLNLKNGNNTFLSQFISGSNPQLSCIQVDNKIFSDSNWSASKGSATNYLENCTTAPTNVAPVITATGNQTYCPLSSLKITTAVTITDPDDTSTDAVYIQVSNGYVNGQDLLTLSNPSVHISINATWNANEGKLKLSSPTAGTAISYTDFIAAIKDVVFSNSSTSPSGVRNFSISIGQANYLPTNGHYYQYVPNLGITWTAAKVAAESSIYFGLHGYLATITADDEARLAGKQAPGAGWIGGTDAATEGVWKWVTGPEGLANGGAGTIFWNGLANGTSPNFAFWNTNEPNQSGDEDYAHITAPGVGIAGSWNDLSSSGATNGNFQPKGYIVEYGGLVNDPVLQISASTSITIPKIESTTPNNICNSGSVTLQATASNGSVYWYTSKTGGTLLFTGDSYTTLSLSTTTSYYVAATNGNCSTTPRIEVTATVQQSPTITATNSDSVCTSGTVTLGATASAGTINWYKDPTGGSIIGTGTTFITPIISATTIYYTAATNNGCISLSRTPVTATVTIPPSIITTAPAVRCGSGTVILDATASAGTLNWYDVANAGTILSSGNSFLTPSITTTTPFYVEAVLNGCATARTAVTATVYPLNTITEEIILCQGATTILDASIPNMIYRWSPGGETTQTILVSATGNYSVTISSPTVISCDSKKEISVIAHPEPSIKSIDVSENAIVIQLKKPERYFEYSINGLDFQALNQFSYLSTGEYTAYIRENNGCNLVTQIFTIFTVPKFFTPNNDGFNDMWEIKEMAAHPYSTAQIFDRYGKLIIELNASNYSWNGKYKRNFLPADDYWYKLKLDNSTPEMRGHFTLKR